MKYAGYMGLAPGQRDDHEQDPRAVKLRGMLVNERAHSISDLEAFLHALPRDEAARLINAGNRNGKTPFHHACQFRSAPEAVKLLLENSANVNQTTRRGHTALIYACGRGRGLTVATLLTAGARVKVRAVTGDDALSMAQGRLDRAMMDTLRQAFEAADAAAEPWLDFTEIPDAQAAQIEHVSGCKHCKEKHAKAVTAEVPLTSHELAHRATLDRALDAALMADDDSAQRDAITLALVQTAIALDAEDIASCILDSSHPSLVHVAPDRFRALRIGIALFLNKGPLAVLGTLAATKEERLGRQLNGLGVRDRKFPRIILSCLSTALQDHPEVLADVPVRAIHDATDLHVSMELSLLKPRDSLTPADRDDAATLWSETLCKDGGARYTNQLLKERGAACRRRYDSGLKTMQMVYLLRWGVDMQLSVSGQGETSGQVNVVRELVAHAKRCILLPEFCEAVATEAQGRRSATLHQRWLMQSSGSADDLTGLGGDEEWEARTKSEGRWGWKKGLVGVPPSLKISLGGDAVAMAGCEGWDGEGKALVDEASSGLKGDDHDDGRRRQGFMFSKEVVAAVKNAARDLLSLQPHGGQAEATGHCCWRDVPLGSCKRHKCRTREGAVHEDGVAQGTTDAEKREMEVMRLDVGYQWISTAAAVDSVLLHLESATDSTKERASEDKVYVGIDCEWGDRETPALIQLSVCGKIYLIDALLASSVCAPITHPHTHSSSAAQYQAKVKEVLLKLFDTKSPFIVVGFAFERDMEKLLALVPDLALLLEGATAHKIVDLQKIALESWREQAGPRRKNSVPSLKGLCECFLGMTLDKKEQCSEWETRPLTRAQLEYAALDARLLDAHLLPLFRHLL